MRKANPGRFTLDAECCPALELEMCEPVQSECTLKNNYGINGLFKRGVTGLSCSLDQDEVMTGWKVTSEGCPEVGRVQPLGLLLIELPKT